MEQPIKHSEIIQPGNPFDEVIKGADLLLKQIEKLKTELRESSQVWLALSKSQNASTKEGQKNLTVSGQVAKEYEQQQSRLAKAEAQVKTVRSDANRELIRYRESMRKANQEIKQSIRASDAQKGSLERNRIALSKLTERYNRAAPEAARKMTKRVDELTNKIRKQEQAIGKHQRDVGKYGKAFDSVKGAIIGFGASMMGATALLMGFIRGIRTGIKNFIEFEDTFSNVLTLLDKAQKKQFGGLLKKGAAELIGQFGFEIQDLNKALFDAISAGIPAGDAINYLRQASILAVGGASDLSSVILGSTKIINAYNLSIAETNKVMNALFTAQKFGQTTVQELSQSIGTVTSAGQKAQIPVNELLAVFAVLTKRLKNTDEAATAISATLNALMAPGEQSAKLFEKLGIQVGITGIRQQGLFNILKKIVEVTDEDVDVLTELIPNIRALRGVGAMTTETLKEYEEVLAIINEDYGEGSSMIEGYTEKTNTLGQQWKMFTGNLKTAFLENRRVNETLLATQILFTLINKAMSETVELMPKVGEMEERLAIVAAEKAEAERLRLEIEEKRKKYEENKLLRANTQLAQSLKILDIFDEETKRVEEQLNLELKLEEIREQMAYAREMRETALQEKLQKQELETNEAIRRNKEEQDRKELEDKEKLQQAIIQVEQLGLEGFRQLAGERMNIVRGIALYEQAIALKESIINISKGIGKNASAAPFPANLPLIIGFLGQIAGIIATIKGVKFAEGGSGLLDYDGGVLPGKSHREGGVNLGEIGEGEAGEYFGIINRQMTRRYSGDLPDIFESLNRGTFHSVFSRANMNLVKQQSDPYTKKMYELMLHQPTVYNDSGGDTVLMYPNGNKIIIKR